MIINFFERDYKNGTLKMAHIEETNQQDIIVDFISNESFKLELSGIYLPKKYNLIVCVDKKSKDMFVIDKVDNAKEIYCKHILNIYDQKNKVENEIDMNERIELLKTIQSITGESDKT